MDEGRTGIKSYALRGGRMTAAQERSYQTLAPRFCIPPQPALIDIPALFGNRNPLTVEIGFGMGIATAEIAGANRDKNYIGIEVFKSGIGRLLWEIEKRDLANIRIIEGDAVWALANMVADGSVAAFHLFFPDPWPKKRHHKRRLIQRPFTNALEQKLVDGGAVYMATDWAEYGEWALEELTATENLVNVYTRFAPPQPWRPETKFEKKGKTQAHEIRELYFIKKGNPPIMSTGF